MPLNAEARLFGGLLCFRNFMFLIGFRWWGSGNPTDDYIENAGTLIRF